MFRFTVRIIFATLYTTQFGAEPIFPHQQFLLIPIKLIHTERTQSNSSVSSFALNFPLCQHTPDRTAHIHKRPCGFRKVYHFIKDCIFKRCFLKNTSSESFGKLLQSNYMLLYSFWNDVVSMSFYVV